MTVFFTADSHFGHSGLVERGHRRAASVEAMDAALLAAWRARVRPEDTVWHLGDFTLGNAALAESYLEQLPGQLHLIWGNHDRPAVRRLSRWQSSQYAAEIRVAGVKLTLCHYAMRVWNNCRHGALMLHGHSHGGLSPNRQSIDVGVDLWDGFPVTLEEIQGRLRDCKPYVAEDHHYTNHIDVSLVTAYGSP